MQPTWGIEAERCRPSGEAHDWTERRRRTPAEQPRPEGAGASWKAQQQRS